MKVGKNTHTGTSEVGQSPLVRDASFDNLVIGRLVLAGVVFRVFMLAAGFADIGTVRPTLHTWGWIVVASALILFLHGHVALALLRRAIEPSNLRRLWILSLDVGLAGVLNLWSAVAQPPGALRSLNADFFTPYLIGSLTLWTGIWGVSTGAILLGWSAAVELLMLVANRIVLDSRSVSLMADRTLWLSSGFLVGVLVLNLAAGGTKLVRARAEELGRERERLKQQRQTHDTVLQTLDLIVLLGERQDYESKTTLERVVQLARIQGGDLRRVLTGPDGRIGPLFEELSRIARDLEERTNLRIELVGLNEQLDLPDKLYHVLLDAAREALRNVEKHARARTVNVLLELSAGTARVVVRDDGVGFDPSEIPGNRLGIRQSIEARLREAGGGCNIVSRKGRGTRIELWLPFQEQH